ncbi:MerR family transcriptional regulator [Nitratireductor mangrovi]|uniref:MerR family transcriptional regulator n=1 Tax=Nitratireductor mangrovi TaxID=2599600 RepID=A0A5B8KYQ0_9HYPH|nr:MerR family transcriptional regulator [Nitratireductor mangrovi]
MFRIGEFAQIAQVSGRQLRYYDQLGLLHPEHVDRATGYRYYSVRQLPRLNAILALKELGLTLEQIGRAIAPAASGSRATPAERFFATSSTACSSRRYCSRPAADRKPTTRKSAAS